MARVKIYMRVARNGNRFKFAANHKPIITPLSSEKFFFPTVGFALMLDIPDEMFKQAERVIAEVKIPEEQVQICAEVTEVEA